MDVLAAAFYVRCPEACALGGKEVAGYTPVRDGVWGAPGVPFDVVGV